MDEFVQVKGAEIKTIDGIDHYVLTQEGERDARFIAIAIGKYDYVLYDIEENEIYIIYIEW